VRYAINCPDVGEPADLVDFAVAAEAHGWDGFFLWDHLHLERGMRLDVVDPWVVLGAIAQATSTIRLGTMVTPVPRRRPWKLAKEIVTLDRLSGGRVVIGAGLGFPAGDEFGAFDEETDDRVRAAKLDEGLAILEQCLRGGPVSFRGEHFTVDADLNPGALQRPRPPIWIAAIAPSRKPLARAARFDGVMPIGATGFPATPDELADYLVDLPRRDGFDIVAPWHPDVTDPADYAAVGATWLVESTWPEGDWLTELRERTLNRTLAST
jgi:alkanesulfonate monooxygenase SsuD/methylene tetrahydromethanopterin reductase-like flavin-dependent oxidoreductase (luciferase family)